jgi:hypothetical protein
MRKVAMSLMACALLSAPLFADDQSAQPPVPDNAKPDATVQLKEGSVAVGIGYVWGHGTLTYHDKPHKFKISGASVVDVGSADTTATGNVYNLNKLADFSGNYTAVAAGLTVAGGGSVAYMKNEHGVVIKLTATTVGLRVNLAAEGVHITLSGST